MMEVHRERRVTWFVLGLIFLGLTATALLVFDSNKKDEEAIDKANQLMAELKQAGMLVPQPQQIYDVLGDDGGAVCATPADALATSILYGQLTNGAAGPGQRPVIADNNAFQGVALIIKIYCPEKAADFQKEVADLKTADVAG
jgi:hypothetical protein